MNIPKSNVLEKWLSKAWIFFGNIFSKVDKRLFLIGLAIRLLLMPFTMMTDLSHIYFDVLSYPTRLSLFSFFSLNGLSYLIHFFFAKAVILFFPYFIWFSPSFYSTAPNSLQIIQENFMQHTYSIEYNFLSFGYVFLKVFLAKIPLFIFEIGSFILFLEFFKKEKILSAHKFWLFNPIILFVNYCFGTPDIFAVFFVLFSLVFAYKKKYFLSILFAGFSVWSRFYSILYLPFLLIYIYKKKNLKIFSKFAFFLFLLSPVFLLNKEILYIFKNKIALAWPYNYFFYKAGEINPLFFVYFFIVLFYVFYSNKKFLNFVSFSFIGIMSIFATINFHTQWFLFVIPFYGLVALNSKILIKVFFIHTLSFFTLLLKWGNHTTLNILMPINPSYISSLPEISNLISNYINFDILITFLWTIFVAISFFCIFHVLTSCFRKHLLDKKEI